MHQATRVVIGLVKVTQEELWLGHDPEKCRDGSRQDAERDRHVGAGVRSTLPRECEERESKEKKAENGIDLHAQSHP